MAQRPLVRGTSFGLVRLLVGAASALLALLALLPAPTTLLWMAAIGVTEWGHVLALIGLATVLPGWRRSRSGRIGGTLGLGAALLALTPLIRAIPLAQDVPAQLDAAFGGISTRDAARPAAFSIADLLRGVATPDLRPRSLVYALVEGQELRLDLYQPPAPSGPAPAVIVIHGGSWQNGDSSEFPQLNRYLAARGYVVAALNYRLAPRWPFPAARDDVQAAIVYLKEHAVQLGIDPERLVLLGRSAGGQLALLVAYTAADPSIRGVVSLYGPTDMNYGYANPSNPAVIDSRGTLEAYLGGPPTEVPTAYQQASPLEFVGPATPPTLLLHGRRDELVASAHSERLDARLAEAGRPHLLLRLPWATHGFDFNFSGPGGQISTYAIERFVAAVTTS